MDVYAWLFVFIRPWIPRNLTHLAEDYPIFAATKLCLSWTKVKLRSQYTCYAIELSSSSTWLLALRGVTNSHANVIQLLFWSIFLNHQICLRNWAIYVVKVTNSEEFDIFSLRCLSLLLQNFVSLKPCWKWGPSAHIKQWSYPLTEHDIWLGVGRFAYNNFHVW